MPRHDHCYYQPETGYKSSTLNQTHGDAHETTVFFKFMPDGNYLCNMHARTRAGLCIPAEPWRSPRPHTGKAGSQKQQPVDHDQPFKSQRPEPEFHLRRADHTGLPFLPFRSCNPVPQINSLDMACFGHSR